MDGEGGNGLTRCWTGSPVERYLLALPGLPTGQLQYRLPSNLQLLRDPIARRMSTDDVARGVNLGPQYADSQPPAGILKA